MTPSRPVVLTIAGSDSGAGAGIQGDLKSIAANGGYGLTAITALTAQNGLGVDGVFPVPADFVLAQLETLLAGFPVRAAKTGMLFSAEIIDALAKGLERVDFPLVVDPVAVAQSGSPLLRDDAVESLKSRLLPLATLVTPNRHEAHLLSGIDVFDWNSGDRAAKAILALGPKAVLLKGGHFDAVDGMLEDRLYWADGTVASFPHKKIPTEHTHGTGCALSAAVATGLAKGLGLCEAVGAAQAWLDRALLRAYAPGLGFGPPDHLGPALA